MKTFLKRLRLAHALQIIAVTLLMPGMVLMPTAGFANPSGGVVAQGAAEINAETLGHLKVFQTSNRAVINWESFSIGAGEITEFIQPGTDSMALSRVTGGNPSAIYGLLKANGGHILVNTNGILVGAGGRVDVGGLNVLSTLDIDDNDFMAGGDMRFFGDSSAGVTNFGTITSAEGDVILMGNFVENHGSIGALNGTVALAAGGEILLHSSGDAKVSILRAGPGGDTGVNNTGTITGAAVEMKAHGNVYALAVNNSGTIRATGANRVNGRVILSATGDGSASGKIVNTGVIEANNADGSGGEILIDAGVAGEAEIGGTVRADGVGNKPGGSVTVLGDIINVTDGALVSASGSEGGTVMIGSPTSSSVNVGNAIIQATGTNGNAGSIQVAGQLVGLDGQFDATSEQATGGEVTVTGADVSTTANSMINTSGFASGGVVKMEAGDRLLIGGGEILANGQTVRGGTITTTGAETVIGAGSIIKADGDIGGGEINVGGGFQGNDADIPNAEDTTVEAGADLSANAISGSDGGTVIVWSDGDTFFGGSAKARALGIVGNGGLIEISGKERLTMRGSVAADAVSGNSGMVLFDPGNVSVGNVGTADIPNNVVNDTLQGGTSVIIFTGSGDISFLNTGLQNDRHDAIQWTNSNASFGALASGNIFVDTHIRTSGLGSINLISGWSGDEADFDAGGIFLDPKGTPLFAPSGTGEPFYEQANPTINPEDVWEHYVENGQFGFNSGSIFINNDASNRHVVVGSRYGNTNVAGAVLFSSAALNSTGESDYTHLGFRDTGQVFAVRGTNGFGDGQLDLNTPGNYSGGARSPFQVDNDPVVGINDVAYYNDIDGDTIADGVYGINSFGVLNEDNAATGGGGTPGSGGGDATLIPFANHFMSERYGNWWWQQIDAQSPDPLLLGGRTPESGAGQSAVVRADINVVTTGPIIMKSGGRHQAYTQIGHGGDGTGWADDKSLRDTNTDNNMSQEWARLYSYNGAQSDRSGTSIARLAPIYGNINILTGVDRSSIQYDRGDLKKNLTGDTPSKGGFIDMTAWQDTASSNVPTNPEQGNNSESYVQIGHLGTGQFGSAFGEINVQAGGDINILAGAHTRNHATIGHTMNGFNEWNPPANTASQIRFFANAGDFDNPNLRKGELFMDDAGGIARGFYAPGTQGGRYDDDFTDGTTHQAAANGVLRVAGLTGSTDKTIAGNITVDSYGDGGIQIKGFSNPDTRTRTTDDITTIGDLDGDGVGARADGTDDPDDTDGLQFARDRRFAGIGHGGSSFDFWASHDNERVRLRTVAGVTESVEIGGTDNSSRIGRATTFVNLIGDIEVNAHNGNIAVLAGNDTFDQAYIGHGGSDLSDFETSNVVIGDITVTGAGTLDLAGAAVQSAYTGANNRDFYTYGQIGHHGRENGLQYYAGDISVNFGGDITLTGGRYRESGAKIGHQSQRGFGQVSGEFTRAENFIFSPQLDGAGVDINAAVTSSSVTITIDGTSKIYAISGYTSDVDVKSGGDILMTHALPGLRENQNQFALEQTTGVVGNDFHDTFYSPTQIGHGGRETGAFRNNGDTPSFNYKDKAGDITVSAGTATVDPVTGAATITGGDITMENGEGYGWWTVIGNTFGASGADRGNGPNTVDGSWNVFGDITVNALGDLFLNSDKAGSTDTVNVFTHAGEPTQYNPVRIGHGGIFDNLDIISLDDGTVINGIASSADIVVNVGNDLTLKGGKGARNVDGSGNPTGAAGMSYAQIGHGYTSNTGNDPARPSGFNGDITVTVGNNMTLEASNQAVVHSPIVNEYLPVEGGAAVIGHGGLLLDADLSGAISVYVGKDLNITAGDRSKAIDDPTNGFYEIVPSTGPIESIYNFAKIGHWSTELDALPGQSAVDGDMEGAITVVVGNDLTMTGGKAGSLAAHPNVTTSLATGNVFAYSQIGHSGPGINGIKDGDITVLVGNDLTTVDGDVAPAGLLPNLNNYVMIGNGDWLRDGPSAALPATGGPGLRSGDIRVAVGENANLDHTLIGHADPAVMTNITAILSGNTHFGVSRNTPFYGGTGTLTATNGTAFSSGTYGYGTELRIYIPQRELNLMDATTRLNERTAGYRLAAGGGISFLDDVNTFDSTRNGGIDAGDPDEIYLQPDLYWDHALSSTAFGNPGPGPYLPDWVFNGNTSLQDWLLKEVDYGALPTGANAEEFFALANPELGTATLPNGQIATVSNPGGLPNVVSIAAGLFGSGTTDYRGGNGLSGAGNYTVYYDAVAPVSLAPALPPAAPLPPFIPPVVEIPPPIIVLPFNFLPFIFTDKYDSYDRNRLWLSGGWESYLEGMGLISRNLNENEGEPGVGFAYTSEAMESLAEILGLPVDETDETAEDDEREKNSQTYNFLVNPAGIYWQFQLFEEAGRYSSNSVFGTMGL